MKKVAYSWHISKSDIKSSMMSYLSHILVLLFGIEFLIGTCSNQVKQNCVPECINTKYVQVYRTTAVVEACSTCVFCPTEVMRVASSCTGQD